MKKKPSPLDTSDLQALAAEARKIETAARYLVDHLEKLLENSLPTEVSSQTYKRADGRMTDAGIIAINRAFTLGQTVTDVAREFDITVSAASNRRKIWLAGLFNERKEDTAA